MTEDDSVSKDYSFRRNRIAGGIGADDGFWENLEDGTFAMCRCPDCKQWMWPALWRCPHCGAWEQEWVPVDPTGTVYSWTRSWYAFDRTQARADEIPYVVVLAELPQAGNARVLGQLTGPEEGLRVGARVEAELQPPSQKTLGYPSIRWRLVG